MARAPRGKARSALTLSYVWRRGDAAAEVVNWEPGSPPSATTIGCEATPQPLSRVVRLVAGVAASYSLRNRYTSDVWGVPITGYLRISIFNGSATVGYPKLVHESVCAGRVAIAHAVPNPATVPYPLPDLRTSWSLQADTVDTRRSDFGRGLDPEGDPFYGLEFFVTGFHPVPAEAGLPGGYASYRAFLKILCEVGTPD